MSHEIVRVTSKGQMTIPVGVRRALGISSGDSLIVSVEGSEVKLRRLEVVRPLESADPIWKLIGAGESGETDISEAHDRHLSGSEVKRWQQ